MTRPVRPRNAASLVLVRQACGGPEVLMGRRPPRSAFAPDVFVFPGGSLHAEDAAAPLALHPDCARRAGAASLRRAGALAAAAVRETLEETGLTLAPDARLSLIARAVTPTDSPIRFHARFFHADAGQVSGELGGDGELADLDWRALDVALALPVMDVTEAVLRAVQASGGRPPAPFLYAYRRGRPWTRPL